MASYSDLNQLLGDADLRGRVKVACLVAAEAVRAENAGTANHAARLAWARRAFQSPEVVAGEMLAALLAANAAATLAQIQGAADAAVLAKVAAAVDLFSS